MNYAELVELIQDYCETRETSFVANIPRFVKQTEQRIYRTVMIPELRKITTLTATAGTADLAKPADFLTVFSFAVIDTDGAYYFLYDKDPSFIREAYPSGTQGLPKYYALLDGDDFLLGPTPAQAYSFELQYYHDPESIVTAGTTWLGDNAETVLLYGCLVEAYTYLKGDTEMMAQYRQQYDTALGQLLGIDVRSKRDDYRDGQMRVGR
jgi:hypothetical protein